MSWIGPALLGFCAALTICGAADEGFCAVVLSVEDHAGEPFSNIPVELIDASGRLALKTETRAGTARVCDFGFGEHSLVVGGDARHSVVIRRVRLIYGITQRLRVVLNSDRWEVFLLSVKGPICGLYIRVSSVDGSPIGGARISCPATQSEIKTDQYGRAMIPIRVREASTVQVDAKGYKQAQFEVTCESQGEIQRMVQLERHASRHE